MNFLLDSPVKEKILVVDDNLNNLQLLVNMLTENSYEILAAANGSTALMIADANPPDLILLDVRMPKIDGYEVCRQLKENSKTKDIPIIFISALDEVFERVKGFELGAVDYIAKPIQIEEVLARVRTHLSLRSIQKKLEHEVRTRDQLIGELEAFGHTVAHDIASPISAIIINTDFMATLLKRQGSLDINYVDRLVEIKSIAFKITHIINELMLLSQVRKEEIISEPISMDMIVSEALKRLSHKIKETNAVIITPKQWLTAWGYGPWIEEVWINYINNGLKYGGKPPVLELGATQKSNNYVQFWLRDNGIGIPPEEIDTIFTEFTRLEDVQATGYGLGLSIVKRIITKLNGKVGVESVEGVGSCFYFELPGNSD
ncbi:MAG: response regulator [Deltaproteobacteria bacterium]|nr:response regulator [Deltaproteobacteria bacterium]